MTAQKQNEENGSNQRTRNASPTSTHLHVFKASKAQHVGSTLTSLHRSVALRPTRRMFGRVSEKGCVYPCSTWVGKRMETRKPVGQELQQIVSISREGICA